MAGQSLTGASGDDTFYFRGPGSVDGIVDGGAGFDTLDFLQSDFIQEAASDFLVVDLPVGNETVDFAATGGIVRIEDILVILLAEVQEDGTIKRYVTTGDYFGNQNHYFRKPELQLLVESCGFRVNDIWGDRSGQPFSSQSRNIIVLAEKEN